MSPESFGPKGGSETPEELERGRQEEKHWDLLRETELEKIEDENNQKIKDVAYDNYLLRLHNEQLQQAKDIDLRTGLLNHHAFTAVLEESLKKIGVVTEERRKEGGAPKGVSVIFIDLDGFKAVNDKLGHGAGDEILKEVARLLERGLRPGEVPARRGGDEFLVLLPNVSEEQALGAANKLLEMFQEDKALSENNVTASFGICSSTVTTDPNQLQNFADMALNEAKAAGKKQIKVYSGTPKINER